MSMMTASTSSSTSSTSSSFSAATRSAPGSVMTTNAPASVAASAADNEEFSRAVMATMSTQSTPTLPETQTNATSALSALPTPEALLQVSASAAASDTSHAFTLEHDDAAGLLSDQQQQQQHGTPATLNELSEDDEISATSSYEQTSNANTNTNSADLIEELASSNGPAATLVPPQEAMTSGFSTLADHQQQQQRRQRLGSANYSTAQQQGSPALQAGTGVLQQQKQRQQENFVFEDYFGKLTDFSRIFAMVAIMIGDICGNSLVILSVVRHTKLRVTTNWFVVSLACADILVAVFAMTFNASVQITGQWIFPSWMCDFWNSCDVLASTASILHLCCISIDRYYAIMRPLDYPMKITTRRVCYALAVVWISSALLSYIPIFTGIYTTSEHVQWMQANPDQCKFVVNRVYAIVSSSISFWIPCCIMVFTYYKIYQEATRQEKFMIRAQSMMPPPQINHQKSASSTQSQRSKQQRSKSMAITSLSSSSSTAVVGGAANSNNNNNNNNNSSSNKLGANSIKEARIKQFAEKQQQQLKAINELGGTGQGVGGSSTTVAIATSSDALNVIGSECAAPKIEIQQPTPLTPLAPLAEQQQQPLTGSALNITTTAATTATDNNNNNNNSGSNNSITVNKMQVVQKAGSMMTKQQQQQQQQQDDQDERDSNSGQSTPTKRSISKMKREHKAAKTLGIIMGVFILCWLPFFSWYTPQHICGQACEGSIPESVVSLLFWIGYFNSTLNPIIYAYFNHEFRDAFKKTLQWIFCCCRDLKCLRVNRPNDNQHYNCTYRSTQEIGLVTNG